MNLKLLQENIGIMLSSIIFIIVWLITYFKGEKKVKEKSKENFRSDEKKVKEVMLKFDGIEEIAENINQLKNNCLQEQMKVVEENIPMVTDKFLEAYCELLDIEKDSQEYVNHSYYFMDAIKEKSFFLLKEVVINNHIADRYERDWSTYKANKLDFILNETMKHGRKVYREDKMGISYEQIFLICNQKTLEIFQKYVPDVLELLREVAIKYKKKIDAQKDILKRMKETTFNGFIDEKI